MNWHERYLHQAAWTLELRRYLFEKCNWAGARRVLEVGCGTGAVLRDPAGARHQPHSTPELFGLDIAAGALYECRKHAPDARLTQGDVLALPYSQEAFDITYCHFLLLWIEQPMQALHEMKRVTVRSGYVLALAEPDYRARIDGPAELAWLGQLQNEALERQGASLSRGSELADLFKRAGIRILETGQITPAARDALTVEAWESEWDVLAADVAGMVKPFEMQRMRALDRQAWLHGERVLSVPTYFAWGQV